VVSVALDYRDAVHCGLLLQRPDCPQCVH
jgi:hypothetical protein